MYKVIGLLALSTMFLAGCEVIETRLPPDVASTTVDYETEANEPDEEEDEATARLAATEKGKIVIGYMNNETELFRPSSYTITLWKNDALVNGTTQQVAASVTGRKPTATAKKNNLRSYTRKTLAVGWYVANVADSDLWLQFHVTAGSDGLVCFNENSPNPLFFGQYASYGKIKVSPWYGNVHPTDFHLVLAKNVADPGQPLELRDVSTWLYAEDGTGARKGMYFYMPAGEYYVSHWANKPDGSGSYPTAEVGKVTIAAGKIYPHVKLAYK